MANFSSATYALNNLLIGLGRGYWKERRRLERRAKGNLPWLDVLITELEGRFVGHIMDGLGDYFPGGIEQEFAHAVLKLINTFKEQKGAPKHG